MHSIIKQTVYTNFQQFIRKNWLFNESVGLWSEMQAIIDSTTHKANGVKKNLDRLRL